MSARAPYVPHRLLVYVYHYCVLKRGPRDQIGFVKIVDGGCVGVCGGGGGGLPPKKGSTRHETGSSLRFALRTWGGGVYL